MGNISFKCECGKAVSVDAKHAGARGRCPACGVLVAIPSVSAAAATARSGLAEAATDGTAGPAADGWKQARSAATQLPERMRANRAIVGKLCTICQTTIMVGENVQNCSRCQSCYHAECWEQAGGCGTYGCEKSPTANPVPSHGSPISEVAALAQPALATRKPSASHPGSIPRAEPVRRRRSHALIVAAVAGLTVVAIIAITAARNAGLREKLNQCSSNSGIHVRVYYDRYMSTEDVVFDFRGVTGPSMRRIDPVHLLLQFGHKLPDTGLRRLILARDGHKRMYIERTDLRELSREYTYGNPAWSFNHLPERLKTMSGTNAYSQWEGGWLGVLKKQTEDLNQFISDWTGS